VGVFANALSLAVGQSGAASGKDLQEWSGLWAWLLDRFRRRALKRPRLALMERINLAPRQTVALIEADGQRLLVAISPDGAPSFYPLKAVASRSAANRRGKTDSEAESK
jgi:flagellar biogenesis protein FliO